jgi:hypothetical protein
MALEVKIQVEGKAEHICLFEHVLGRSKYRARCSCGWLKYGTKAEVYNAAAVHDLDQYDLVDTKPADGAE